MVHALAWSDDVACLPCRLACSVVSNMKRSTRCNIVPQSDLAPEDFHTIAVLCNIPAAPFEELANTRFPSFLANFIEPEVFPVCEISIDCNRRTKQGTKACLSYIISTTKQAAGRFDVLLAVVAPQTRFTI